MDGSSGLGTMDPTFDEVADEQLESGDGESGSPSGLKVGVSTSASTSTSVGMSDREGWWRRFVLVVFVLRGMMICAVLGFSESLTGSIP